MLNYYNPESIKETAVIHVLSIISLPVVLVRFYYVMYVYILSLSVYIAHALSLLLCLSLLATREQRLPVQILSTIPWIQSRA